MGQKIVEIEATIAEIANANDIEKYKKRVNLYQNFKQKSINFFQNETLASSVIYRYI